MLEMNKYVNKFFGEKNAKHKLTDEEVKDMLFLDSLAVLSKKEICDMFGVHASYISRIRNKERRAHGSMILLKCNKKSEVIE